MEGTVKHLRTILMTLSVTMLPLLFVIPIPTQAQTQMSNVKHVFIILMENHNWTGDNSGASFGDPDIKGSSLAPYINSLIPLRAHAEQYFNPPGNHPSLPNYLWLEAGTNFGILNDNLPTRKNGHRLNGQTTTAHLVTELVNHIPAVTWKAYAEPDFPNPDFTNCPVNFSEVDVNHLAFVYFSDTTNGFSSSSASCIAHVKPYSHLATDLASGTACTPALITSGTPCYAQYNFITPNLCHDGHEGISPCASGESTDNTLRGDTWLKNIGVPAITGSSVYTTDGALFILWDEAEDSGFRDGPIGMFVLSPFAKTNYQNSIHYDHSSMLKTFQEIFGVTPLLGGAANPATNDLSDFFHP
jgi:phosphatidylinositol-3-phosphatase